MRLAVGVRLKAAHHRVLERRPSDAADLQFFADWATDLPDGLDHCRRSLCRLG